MQVGESVDQLQDVVEPVRHRLLVAEVGALGGVEVDAGGMDDRAAAAPGIALEDAGKGARRGRVPQSSFPVQARGKVS